MEEKIKAEIMTAWKMVMSGNEDSAMLGINSLTGVGMFESPDHALCAMMNYVSEHGDWQDKKHIKQVREGLKPNGWHWGHYGGGRGVGIFHGIMVSYDYHGFEKSPDFRPIAPRLKEKIKHISDVVNNAWAAIQRAKNDFCESVDHNDPYQIGCALLLYEEYQRKSELRFKHILPEEYDIQKAMMGGVFKTPPFSKGQYVECNDEIYLVTHVEIEQSGVNMDWVYRTCSLKKNGTKNEGNQAQQIHVSDIRYMKPTSIEYWEWSGSRKQWVKKSEVGATSGKKPTYNP